MVNDKLLVLRQLPTAVNLADIGTKSLAKQRLSYLMNESGLIYVATGEEVGWEEEEEQQKEKNANSQQIKRITKTLFNMSVAMGLGPVVADAQQCSEPGDFSCGILPVWLAQMDADEKRHGERGNSVSRSL